MKIRAIVVVLTLVVAMSATGQALSGRYVARGFYSEDAMLASYFTLVPQQRETVHMDRMRPHEGQCHWYPFMLVYEGREGETSSPYLSTTTIRRGQEWALSPVIGDEFTYVKEIASPDVIAVEILWTGSRWCGPVSQTESRF